MKTENESQLMWELRFPKWLSFELRFILSRAIGPPHIQAFRLFIHEMNNLADLGLARESFKEYLASPEYLEMKTLTFYQRRDLEQ